MSYTITGTVHSVEAEKSREYNGKTHKSRDIILSCPETFNGKEYSNYPKLTATKEKVMQYVSNLRTGQTVTLHFNIKGYNGQRGNFTSLDVWKVDAQQPDPAPQPQQQYPAPQNYQAHTQDMFHPDYVPPMDDLPF